MPVAEVLMCEATVIQGSRNRKLLYIPKEIQEKLEQHGVKKVKVLIFVEKKCKGAKLLDKQDTVQV